jgi:hypothetical protein
VSFILPLFFTEILVNETRIPSFLSFYFRVDYKAAKNETKLA